MSSHHRAPVLLAWALGVSVSGFYSFREGYIDQCLGNTSAAFNVGGELALRRLFITVDAGWMEADVAAQFEYGGTWPATMPLDVELISLGMGGRIPLTAEIILKPTATISWWTSMADDRIRSFVGIDRVDEFTTAGLAMGGIVRGEGNDYQGLEYGVGLEWQLPRWDVHGREEDDAGQVNSGRRY